jgi:hypothetical protein
VRPCSAIYSRTARGRVGRFQGRQDALDPIRRVRRGVVVNKLKVLIRPHSFNSRRAVQTTPAASLCLCPLLQSALDPPVPQPIYCCFLGMQRLSPIRSPAEPSRAIAARDLFRDPSFPSRAVLYGTISLPRNSTGLQGPVVHRSPEWLPRSLQNHYHLVRISNMHSNSGPVWEDPRPNITRNSISGE